MAAKDGSNVFEFSLQIQSLVAARCAEDGQKFFKVTWKPCWLSAKIVQSKWESAVTAFNAVKEKASDHTEKELLPSSEINPDDVANNNDATYLQPCDQCEHAFETFKELKQHYKNHEKCAPCNDETGIFSLSALDNASENNCQSQAGLVPCATKHDTREKTDSSKLEVVSPLKFAGSKHIDFHQAETVSTPVNSELTVADSSSKTDSIILQAQSENVPVSSNLSPVVPAVSSSHKSISASFSADGKFVVDINSEPKSASSSTFSLPLVSQTTIENSILCPVCLSVFDDTDEFEKHCFVQCVPQTTGRIHACDRCGKSFSSLPALQAHTKLHNHSELALKVHLKHKGIHRSSLFLRRPHVQKRLMQNSGTFRNKNSSTSGENVSCETSDFAAGNVKTQTNGNSTLASSNSTSSRHEVTGANIPSNKAISLEPLKRLVDEQSSPGASQVLCLIEDVLKTLEGKNVPRSNISSSLKSGQNQVNDGDAFVDGGLPQSKKRKLLATPEEEAHIGNSVMQYVRSVWKKERVLNQAKERKRALEHPNAIFPSDPIVGTLRGQQAYKCRNCGKISRNRFHHDEHFRLHSGDIPYDCEFCGKRFRQRSGWSRHVKIQHGRSIYLRSTLQDQSGGKSDDVCISTPGMSISPINSSISSSSMSKVTALIPPQSPMSSRSVNSLSGESREARSRFLFANQQDSGAYLIQRSDDLQVPSGASPGVLLQPAILPTAPAQDVAGAGPVKFVFQDGSNSISSDGLILEGSNQTNVPTVYLPLPLRALTGSRPIAPKQGTAKPEFQFKEVSSIDGNEMIIIKHARCPDGTVGDEEFAYVVDKDGTVTARFPIGSNTSDWKDVPMSKETINEVKRSIQAYDEMHRRGRKIIDCNMEIQERLLVVQQKMKDKPDDKSVKTSNATDASAGTATSQCMSYGRTFLSGKEKRFSCSVCNRRFLAQAHVNEHMKIHTGELPYKCMFCGQRFRHKSGMNSHHRRHIKRGIFDRPITNRSDRAKEQRSMKNAFVTTNAKEPASTSAATSSGKTVHSVYSVEDIAPYVGGGDMFDADAELAAANVDITSPLSSSSDTEVLQSKRKMRRPVKQVRAEPVVDLARVKIEEDTEEDPSKEIKSAQATIGSVERYKCMFCPQMFHQRHVYVTHLSTDHKSIIKSSISGYSTDSSVQSAPAPTEGVNSADITDKSWLDTSSSVLSTANSHLINMSHTYLPSSSDDPSSIIIKLEETAVSQHASVSPGMVSALPVLGFSSGSSNLCDDPMDGHVSLVDALQARDLLPQDSSLDQIDHSSISADT